MREQHRTPDWTAELGSGTELEQGLMGFQGEAGVLLSLLEDPSE